MNDPPCWLGKAALRWNKTNNVGPSSSPSSDCPYWNKEELRLDQLDDKLWGSPSPTESDTHIATLSYRSLAWVTTLAVQSLRRMIYQHYTSMQQHSAKESDAENDEENEEALGIPIAVAIPEGPLLPLAILAVHVLNQPFREPSSRTSRQLYAILIPMDPSEGKERLQHMIQDTQPVMILCASTVGSSDSGRIQQAMANPASSAGIDYRKDSTKRTMHRPNLGDMKHVGFSQLLQNAIDQCQETGESLKSFLQTRTVPSTVQPPTKAPVDNNGNSYENLVQIILECLHRLTSKESIALQKNDCSRIEDGSNRISHIVYTSGTTGKPKGCVCSTHALRYYLTAKNKSHNVTERSTVVLASSISFDPCLGDVLATWVVGGATLAIVARHGLLENLRNTLKSLQVTHVLCTPTLWSMMSQPQANHIDDNQHLYGLPHLQVIALGGEPIPSRIVQTWARTKSETASSANGPRLLATYGVTEACVYQTCGEVFSNREDDDDNKKEFKGQLVGRPMRGSHVRIECDTKSISDEEDDSRDMPCSSQEQFGEVVLYGRQVDEFSCYLNQPELSRRKFFRRLCGNTGESSLEPRKCQEYQYYYRTGDRGYIDNQDQTLHILGRIDGEEGMVKINGVRLELGEIESAIVDENIHCFRSHPVVTACLATAQPVDPTEPQGPKRILAYCVLSSQCCKEMDIVFDADTLTGIQCTNGPLLALLQARCTDRVKKGCVPSTFVIIPRLPTSPTGKCDRRQLPPLLQCRMMKAALDRRFGRGSVPLWEYGTSGSVVTDQVVDCLNLQPCQKDILTSGSSFGMLGGDSLGAARVVRSLYAYHHNIRNSRHLGGAHGVLEGPFAVLHLLRAETMGDYVDWLDRNRVCRPQHHRGDGSQANSDKDTSSRGGRVDNLSNDNLPPTLVTEQQEHSKEFRLYQALLEAATRGYSLVAIALLDLGVDPSLGEHGSRLSRISDRNQRKKDFRSNPMHLACVRGDVDLTAKLLENKCKFNSPDASGSFPIHLACSGVHHTGSEDEVGMNHHSNDSEDRRRTACVKLLLEAGAPLSMKDGNKQTVLHCAARSGHCGLLKFLLQTWTDAGNDGRIQVYERKDMGNRFDWPDRWFRTPVHWAVLNNKVEALRILVNHGCSANPPKPKRTSRQTSLQIESPLEICSRLYGDTGVGREIRLVLKDALKEEQHNKDSS